MRPQNLYFYNVQSGKVYKWAVAHRAGSGSYPFYIKGNYKVEIGDKVKILTVQGVDLQTSKTEIGKCGTIEKKREYTKYYIIYHIPPYWYFEADLLSVTYSKKETYFSSDRTSFWSICLYKRKQYII